MISSEAFGKLVVKKKMVNASSRNFIYFFMGDGVIGP